MSSDSSYANFLDQANQDTGTDKAKAQSGKGKGGVKLKSVDTEVPATLQKIDAVYVSEADEEFEGVALTWDGEGELDGDSFAELVGHTDSVESLSTKDFDPKGQYKDVISKVEKEVEGKVKVFRIETDRARVEYYIVGIQSANGKKKVVGVKARAVES
ncbi:hypothetical protein MMC10_004803 [Thelotrema lepadinum]|nr:hypothetical protein [Thelotrema lepadinum]